MGQGQRFDICCDRFGSKFWWALDESLLWHKRNMLSFFDLSKKHYQWHLWPVRHFLHYMVFILLGDFYLDVSFDKHLTQQDTIEPFWDETKERLEHLGSYSNLAKQLRCRENCVWDTLQGTITYPTNGKGNSSSQLPFWDRLVPWRVEFYQLK